MDVILKLKESYAKISYHDPYVSNIKIEDLELESSPLSAGLLKNQDCVVITTNHSCFDIGSIVQKADLIIDTRNATQKIKSKKVIKL